MIQFLITFFPIWAIYSGHQTLGQKLPGPFLPRFHKIVEDWTGNKYPTQTALNEAVHTFIPRTDEHFVVNSFNEAKSEFEKSITNSHENKHVADGTSTDFPVAEFISKAASNSSQRLGSLISSAPVAKAVSNTSNKIIEKAKQSATYIGEYIANSEDGTSLEPEDLYE